MFAETGRKTKMGGAFALIELVYHATVRQVRKTHGNAILGLLLNIFQTVLLVVVFYTMFELLGLRQATIRGDFLLYVMSGIFLFMTHTKTVGAVSGAEGPTSQMMKHAPMTSAVAILSAAFSALYIQVISASVVLYVYHAAMTPITIEYPVMTFGIFLLSWLSGVAVGMIFLSIKPWAPDVANMLSTIYQRVSMIASGKMFVVNTMPGSIIALFDWSPLFHCIDQTRGAVFLNYEPRYTSLEYPIYLSIACLMIGLLAEFYTRRHASVSWSAKR